VLRKEGFSFTIPEVIQAAKLGRRVSFFEFFVQFRNWWTRTAALVPVVFAATKVGTCVHTVGKTLNPHKQYLRKPHIATVHVLEFKLPARRWKMRICVMDLHSSGLDHSLLSTSPSEFWGQTFSTSLFLPIFRHSALIYSFLTPQHSITITSTDSIYISPPPHTHNSA